MWEVIRTVKRNNKRMTKLNGISNGIRLREQIENYVIATARELKVRLTEKEIRKAVAEIMISMEA